MGAYFVWRLLKILFKNGFFIVIIALLSQVVKAQTNIYHKFPESNAFWNIHLNSHSPQGVSDTGLQDYSIIISGDTVINAVVYHKLNIPYIYSLYSPSGEHVGYKGAFRQDTILKKVFIIPNSQNSEQLFYDFNLQIGDTLKGYLSSWLPDYFNIVMSIDSVLLGNSFSKRWNLSDDCYNISIIEGLGSTFGLIECSSACNTVTMNYTLECFNHNSISIYPNSASNCEQLTQITSLEKSLNKIRVFPNPSKGIFTFEIDPSLNICEILLSDLLGNIILRKSVNNQIEFTINNLQTGTYIFSLITKNGNTVHRGKISCQ